VENECTKFHARGEIIIYDHFVREGVAKDNWRTGYFHPSFNSSDVMAKSIVNMQDRKRKVRMIFT